MTRKSLGACVVLLGLLLGTSSAAYADTISITSLTLTNIQLVPASGTSCSPPHQWDREQQLLRSQQMVSTTTPEFNERVRPFRRPVRV